MLPNLKPMVGLICEFYGSYASGMHTITYVGKYGFTAGPYSISTRHSTEVRYSIYDLRHPVTNELLTTISEIRQHYPELFI